jgi:hypothetical protein
MPYTKKFEKLLKSTTKFYTGKKVPLKYRKRYGKVYSKKEAQSVAFAIGRKKGFRT